MIMMIHLFFLLFLLLQRIQSSSPPPVHTLDLSLPPSKRWSGAVRIATGDRTWEESWKNIFQYHNKSLFNKLTDENWSNLGNSLKKYYPMQASEISTIAKEFNILFPQQYVSFNYLAGWVYYHELAHTDLYLVKNIDHFPRECTGIIAQSKINENDSTIHHVANMDQSPTAVRNVTLHVQFINGTKDDILFQGVDFYWFTTGLSRMVLKGYVSVQENWRTSDPPLSSIQVINDIQRGVIPQMFLFRKTMERIVSLHSHQTKPSFNDIIEEWSSVLLSAPFYIVMAGVNVGEGAIIARNQTGVASPNGIVLRFNSTKETNQYLVQTNYDHWEPDSNEDPRRTVAENLLRLDTPSLTQQTSVGINIELFSVASTYPIHNPHTAYTAVMNANTGILLSYVRVAMCPLYSEETYQDNRYSKICNAEKKVLV
jgi:N-acylethanolamine-hydrolysing acid amidase